MLKERGHIPHPLEGLIRDAKETITLSQILSRLSKFNSFFMCLKIEHTDLRKGAYYLWQTLSIEEETVERDLDVINFVFR